MSRMNTRRVRITVGTDQSMMRSEWQKMRHTILLPLHVVIPLLGSSLFLLYYRIKNRYGLTEISGFLQIMGTVFPFLIAIVCSRNVQLEEDNHFQTFLGAVKRSKALFAKCAVLHVLGLFAVFLTIGSFALGGKVLFGGTDFKFWGMEAFAMWLGSVPLYWIHLGLNLRFSKNISLGFGVVQMLLSALLLTGLGSGLWYFFPCSWSTHFCMEVLNGSVDPTRWNRLENLAWFPICLLIAAALCAILFLWFHQYQGRVCDE